MSIRAIGLTMALLSAAAPSAAQRSTQEMRDLRPREVERAVRDDLLSILVMPGKVGGGNRRQLGDAVLRTRPVGSGIEGVCQRDLLLLSYAPTRAAREAPPGPRGLGEPGVERLEDVPVRPYGVTAERLYFFTQAPRWEALEDARTLRARFSQNCGADAASAWEGWFAAPAPEDAVVGFLVFEAAARAVAAGRVPLAGCDGGATEPVEQCRSGLARAAANPKSLNAIRTCPTEAGRQCFAVDSEQAVITVVNRLSGKAPSPDDVVSVAYEAYIIVT
ncbi:MAG: hypothetical protein QOG72_558 [Sphingomonadales bacterium]|jgi:hypothetical protein|nr:hypothetical protein [Sphingomonadales bacterium]